MSVWMGKQARSAGAGALTYFRVPPFSRSGLVQTRCGRSPQPHSHPRWRDNSICGSLVASDAAGAGLGQWMWTWSGGCGEKCHDGQADTGQRALDRGRKGVTGGRVCLAECMCKGPAASPSGGAEAEASGEQSTQCLRGHCGSSRQGDVSRSSCCWVTSPRQYHGPTAPWAS